MSSPFFKYPGSAEDDDLGEIPFLGGCSDDDWSLIRQHGQLARYPAGEVVISRGSLDQALHLVVNGELEIERKRSGRRRQRQPVIVPAGSATGESSFLDGKPAPSRVTARVDSEVLRVGLADFEILAAKDSQLAMYVILELGRMMATRVRELESLLDRVT